MLLRKEANAFERLRAYAQAVPLFEQSLAITQRLASQDPQDSRSLFDVVTVLDDEARCYEDAANPILAAKAGDRRANLVLEEKALVQSAADLERLVKQDPANDVWKALQASTQVRIGITRGILHTQGASEDLPKTALAALKEVAGKAQASPMVLDQAASAFLTAEPASLRDPQFAVSCAEREVEMSHRMMPSRLLTLAQAYRANGQAEKSRTTAREGLALLPVLQSGSVKPNTRKLLENEAQIR
jgi:tetratricopeptide (TPR) repeat protein